MISILIGSGFEEAEVIIVYDILKRGGLDAALVSVTGSLEVNSARNLQIKCDFLVDDVMEKKQELVVIPGGMGGVKRIISSPSAKLFLRKSAAIGSLLGAICAGPMVLDKFGLLEGSRYTCYPGIEDDLASGNYLDESVVVDGSLVTSVGPGTAAEFALKLVEILAGADIMNRIKKSWYGK